MRLERTCANNAKEHSTTRGAVARRHAGIRTGAGACRDVGRLAAGSRRHQSSGYPPADSTVPHAVQAIHIDAALPDGVYRHDASPRRLTLGHATNARNLTGYQDFVGAARPGVM
jgi:hypothetical protein